MRIIITLLASLLVSTLTHSLLAQEIPQETSIKALREKLETIEDEERAALKQEITQINEQLENGSITEEESVSLKRAAAEKRAKNIENRKAIVQNTIELIERGEAKSYPDDDGEFEVRFKIDNLFDFRDKPKKIKYDRRTRSDLVLAIGFNNAIQDGVSLSDSDYKFAGSRFFEIGWAWKTRVFDNSNWLRIKYGFSFQFNGLKPTNNRYFVEQTDGEVVLEEFDVDLRKSKFRMDNLVVPVHFEFGPSKKRETKDYIRYSTRKKFKIGVGGFAGFNIANVQKLKFRENGERIKQTQRGDFNTSSLVYGLSSYVAFGSVGVYAKYDLSPIFKDTSVEQRNISLGIRFGMD